MYKRRGLQRKMADTEFNHSVKLELETDFESEQNYAQYEDNDFMNVKSEFDLGYQNEDIIHQDTENIKEEYENYEMDGEEGYECKKLMF